MVASAPDSTTHAGATPATQDVTAGAPDLFEAVLAEHQVTPAVAEAGLLGRAIDKVAYWFAVGIVAAAVILLLEVFLRYVMGSPTLWAHETTIFLCSMAFVFGGLYCTGRNKHIRVVLIYDHLPPRLRRAADVLISLSCVYGQARGDDARGPVSVGNHR